MKYLVYTVVIAILLAMTSQSAIAVGNSTSDGGSKDKPKDESSPPTTVTEPVNPIIPTTKEPVKPGPDFSCHFHPEAPKCAADAQGNCPGGFASNDHGQCHPIGPCPPGFGRHDDDESGKCFRNPDSCPPKFHMGNHKCERDTVINIHKHATTSGSSHSLSPTCFNEIRFAWLAKIHRGQSATVDNIIDKCLGIG